MDELGRLMLITDRACARGRSLAEIVRSAVRGGVEVVQVREKDLSDDALRALVLELRALLPSDVTIIVNSRERVARTLGIGLHLPAAAPPPSAAFRGLWGRSVHDEDEARAAAREGAGYALAGPVFPTASKPGHPGTGIERLRRIVTVLAPVPVFALGGIDPVNAPRAIRAGAHGVAVRGAFMETGVPRRVAEALCLALRVARG